MYLKKYLKKSKSSNWVVILMLYFYLLSKVSYAYFGHVWENVVDDDDDDKIFSSCKIL